jgi:hypothetical protein
VAYWKLKLIRDTIHLRIVALSAEIRTRYSRNSNFNHYTEVSNLGTFTVSGANIWSSHSEGYEEYYVLD